MKKTQALHILTGNDWRGAESQVYQYLLTPESKEIENFVIIPSSAEYLDKFKEISIVLIDPKIFLFSFFLKLYYIYKYNIKALYIHTNKAQLQGLFLKIFSHKLKLIVCRKVAYSINKHIFSSWKYKSKLIDQYIAVSEKIKSVLIEGGVLESKIIVIYDFIKEKKVITSKELEEFKSAHNINKLPSTPIICCLGALDSQKNHKFLIQSLSEVKQKGGSFKCYIAGKGPLHNELNELIKTLQLEDDIFLLGFTKKPHLLLKLSDIFVFPSINEGLGSSLIEASMYDCLLFGSRSGGIPEVIEHDKTGFLFNPEDTTDLSSQLHKVLPNHNSHTDMILNSQLFIQENFNSKISSQKITRLSFTKDV